MDVLSIWLATAVVMIALSGIGRTVTAPISTAFGPLWWGWGLTALCMTLYVTLTPWPLTPFLLGMAGIAFFGYARSQPSQDELKTTAKLALLTLPLIWVWSHNQVFTWDDFAHRLPSYWFAEKFDDLPNPNLPANLSTWPSYPYGLTILGVAISRIVGNYAELALAMVNGVITIAFAGLLASQFSSHNQKISWKILAAALVLTAVANPYMDREFTASAYQETSLSLAMAVAFLLMRPYILANKTPALREALAIGLTLALVTGLKQVGFVLAIMLAAPFTAIISYRLRSDTLHATLISSALMLPMVIIWGVWRWYVTCNIGGGEFSFKTLSMWHWPLIPDMLATFGKILIKKPTVMLMLFILSGMTIFAFKGSRLAPQRYAMLLAIAVGWGYTAFLMVAYLGSFVEHEARNLASFSRYMQHVNWMLWLVFLIAMKEYIAPLLTKRPWISKACFGLMLLPLVIPHHYIGKTNPEAIQMYKLAKVLPSHLPQHTTIRVDEPKGSGFRQLVLQYYVGYDYAIRQGETVFGKGVNITQPVASIQLGTHNEPVILTDCTSGQCKPPVTLQLP